METALLSAPEGSAEQEALASQLEEIQRLKHLVRKLLLLSQRAGDQAVLRAANSADPIPVELHDRIFDRFFQVDDARSGEGTGLGLSLAREIARAHGGRLELISSDPDGTVFELRSPCCPENAG